MQREEYIKHLQLIGSLSRLFSESKKPFLYYRIAEHLFIKDFKATDVSRSDIAIDAIHNNVGVGLKTFQGHNGRASYQKVAEFNKLRSEIEKTRIKRGDFEFVKHIASLRNDRIQFVTDTFSVNDFIYHCVVRDVGSFSIHEYPMSMINIVNIKITSSNTQTVHFTDGVEEYSFSLSKSTLMKKFHENKPLYSFNISIIDEPLDLLLSKLASSKLLPTANLDSIILPLYSTITTAYGEVPRKSGLNQWNADGRPRNDREVYIPIPAKIRSLFPSFLPARKTPFNIILPGGKTILATVAQSDGKALMSNPNSVLGEWLLDQVLHLSPGSIVTREILDSKGIDSVEISKVNDNYHLDFKKIGSYEKFIEENS